MSIKEALERNFSAVSPVKDPENFGTAYEQETKKKGIALLKEAHIPEILEELREIVAVNFPDATISGFGEKQDISDVESKGDEDADSSFAFWADGTVALALGWNYRDDTESGLQLYNFDAISVTAQPLSGALIVQGKEGRLMPKGLWTAKDGRTVLEDAIVQAYNNPATRTGGAPTMLV